ncbi:MAG: orotate phosphoribosyltransferase [Francisellaceae bacterium]
MSQSEFFETAIATGALKFGDFSLKSGRQSPYFFNAGLFDGGRSLSHLAACYAEAIIRLGIEFDVLFGPAYKGIVLAAAVSAQLYEKHGLNVGFAYNRKEVKDHGEGGRFVGADIKDKRVLVIDDVITAGTAIKQSLVEIDAAGGYVKGVIVALDRQEIAPGECISAIDALERDYRFPVYAVANLDGLIDYLQRRGQINQTLIQSMTAYRQKYGVMANQP